MRFPTERIYFYSARLTNNGTSVAHTQGTLIVHDVRKFDSLSVANCIVEEANKHGTVCNQADILCLMEVS